MSKSNINWSLDQIHTWNITSGCTRVSEGCLNCFALKLVSTRLRHLPQNEGVTFCNDGEIGWTGLVRCHQDKLSEPLRRKKPTTYFVCSQSDLFHESVPFEFIHRAWDVMRSCPQHTFMVLTKRPERMRDIVSLIYKKEAFACSNGWFNNIWLGTSVENQKAADERTPPLLACQASKRFLSCEPLLGPVDVKECFSVSPILPDIDPGFDGIDLVIVGGESGPNARPMNTDWPRSLRDQCKEAGVPFFMKQICKNGKKLPFEVFPEDLQVREWPE